MWIWFLTLRALSIEFPPTHTHEIYTQAEKIASVMTNTRDREKEQSLYFVRFDDETHT